MNGQHSVFFFPKLVFKQNKTKTYDKKIKTKEFYIMMSGQLCTLGLATFWINPSFQAEEDVDVLSTQDPEFKTFENLYGLRFARYVVLVKEKFK